MSRKTKCQRTADRFKALAAASTKKRVAKAAKAEAVEGRARKRRLG